MKYLASVKIKNSGFPKDVVTMTQKNTFCQKINAGMKFNHPSLKITPENVTLNEIKKSCAKEALNSKLLFMYHKAKFIPFYTTGILGKLSQNPNQGQNLILNNQVELEKIMNDASHEITDLTMLGEKLVNVKLKKRKGFESFSRRQNLILNSIVTASARIYMHENILKVHAASQYPLYTGKNNILFLESNMLLFLLPLSRY